MPLSRSRAVRECSALEADVARCRRAHPGARPTLQGAHSRLLALSHRWTSLPGAPRSARPFGSGPGQPRPHPPTIILAPKAPGGGSGPRRFSPGSLFQTCRDRKTGGAVPTPEITPSGDDLTGPALLQVLGLVLVGIGGTFGATFARPGPERSRCDAVGQDPRRTPHLVTALPFRFGKGAARYVSRRAARPLTQRKLRRNIRPCVHRMSRGRLPAVKPKAARIPASSTLAKRSSGMTHSIEAATDGVLLRQTRRGSGATTLSKGPNAYGAPRIRTRTGHRGHRRRGLP